MIRSKNNLVFPINVYVRNGIDLFKVCENVDEAKEASKRFWGFRCIIALGFEEPRSRDEVNESGDYFDGCHLFPSGQSRYKPLACLPANIWPMPRSDHRLWDNQSQVEKIRLLTTHAYHEERLLVREIVGLVREMADAC